MTRSTDTLSLTTSHLQQIRRGTEAPVAQHAQHNRVRNLSLILQALMSTGPLTRPALARRLQLSAPTIANLVAELLEKGLVRDDGVSEAAGVGKPPSLIALETEENVVLAIDLTSTDRFAGSIVTISGQVQTERTTELDSTTGGGEGAVEAVIGLVRELTAATAHRVLGVGIASPGLVDDSGVVRVADHLGWRDMDLAGAVRAATGHHVVVGNDVNLMALGLDDPQDQPVPDALVVSLDNGASASLRLHDGIFTGEQFAAGEIGHVTVDPQGYDCVCGRRGCLDAFVNGRLLTARIAEDPEGREAILTTAGESLGKVLASIVSMLNIRHIVLVGSPDLFEGTFSEATMRIIRAYNRPALTEHVEIELVPSGTDLTLHGTVAAVIREQLGVR